MSGQNPRKRAAPGTSPMVSLQRNIAVQQPYTTDHDATANPLMQWNGSAGGAGDGGGGGGGGFLNASAHGDGSFALAPAQPQYQQTLTGPSNLLARRQMNRALIAANPRAQYSNAPVDQWAGFGDNGLLVSQTTADVPSEQDSVEMLEEKAQKAKRDAQTKRKQIPPFVQKLSSFLEERKNEDLIRWSEKGDSFVVLDEDEFAKTLIPELFKHNNYASFVRQLNMYGFHKCVGLSDNSMRASERKNKSPSEYSNPYFRRGHPNLLWLINKPRSGGKGKKGGKGQEGEGDSDEETGHDEVAGHPMMGSSHAGGARSLPAAGAAGSGSGSGVGTESQPLQKKEMAVIREELHKVREQQKLILGAINRLQRNNNELYNQALMFQSQHDRHQNSINAILNFLANVFRKTLEDQGSAQNVGDIISSLMSSQGQPQPHQGSIVDLGDFIGSQADPLPKKARGLLPPIPSHSESVPSPPPPSRTSGAYHHPTGSPSMGASGLEMGHVTELLDTSPSEASPPSLHQELRTNPHESMMRIINDHNNATNATGLDLPGATELVASAPNALNHDQRSRFVNFMASQASPNASVKSEPVPAAAPTTTIPAATTAPAAPSIPASSRISSPPSHTSPPPSFPASSASTSAPPPPPSPPDTTAAPSLSPILRMSSMMVPSLHHISSNQSDCEQLKRLQSDQDAKINELSDLLGPLSPSGHVPGLGSDESAAYFDPPNIDLDQFLDNDAFLNDVHFGDGNDFNFNLEADMGHGGLVPGQAAQAPDTPSPTGTEEITRNDAGLRQAHESKRRRVY